MSIGFRATSAVLVALSFCAAASSTPAAAGRNAAIDLSTQFRACDDFYQYVNGNWLTTAAIPSDRSSWGAFGEVDKRTKADLRALLDEASRDTSASASAGQRKVVQFYRSGMDTAAIDAAGVEPLAGELARIEAIRSLDDLMGVIAHLHRVGVEAGFEFTYTTDVRDSTRYLVELYQAGLGLPDRDYYFRGDAKSVAQRDAYAKHVARMLELLGQSPEQAAAGAATIMRIETLLAKASMTREQRREPKAVNNPTLVGDLARTAPGVDWPRYLRAVGVGDVAEVNVAQPEFMKTFAEAAGTVAMADWKTYLRWHLIHATASKLSAPFVDENFRFYDLTLAGRKVLAPRDERVIGMITGAYGNAPLGMALGELYVARRFPPEAKARALELVENLRAALRERIVELDWMTEPTQRAALSKLDAMKVKIGYPDRWRDYSELRLDGKPFVGQWLAANEFETERVIRMIAKPVDRGEWFTSPHLINAFYQSHFNAIVFPAGILQPPFFDPRRDDAMNYGGIGMIIGHEITHGFDDQGRQFDAQGNLRDWWTAEDAKRYLERAASVSTQYAGYVGVDGLRVNGNLTLGENIADIGGLKLAYMALKRALAKHPQPLIDGLTPDQRFFISFAEVWRTKMTPELERLLIQTDPHSPPRFRVQGSVANMAEFAGAFSCRAAEATLPAQAERAAIW